MRRLGSRVRQAEFIRSCARKTISTTQDSVVGYRMDPSDGHSIDTLWQVGLLGRKRGTRNLAYGTHGVLIRTGISCRTTAEV